jgi:hypothetical protein
MRGRLDAARQSMREGVIEKSKKVERRTTGR